MGMTMTRPLTLAVAGASGETAPELVRDPPVLAGVDYRRLVYRSAVESSGDVQQARRGQSLLGRFLILAAVLWLCELALVNLRPVKPQAVAARMTSSGA